MSFAESSLTTGFDRTRRSFVTTSAIDPGRIWPSDGADGDADAVGTGEGDTVADGLLTAALGAGLDEAAPDVPGLDALAPPQAATRATRRTVPSRATRIGALCTGARTAARNVYRFSRTISRISSP